jgi:hypothetical protein
MVVAGSWPRQKATLSLYRMHDDAPAPTPHPANPCDHDRARVQINASMNVLLYPIEHLIAKRKCPGATAPVLHATEIATTPRAGALTFVADSE